MSLPIPLVVVLALAAVDASAQAAPATASSPSVLAPFRSAFEAYRPFAHERVLPWKEANDNVGRIGGWRAYAREAGGLQPQDVPASASGADTPQRHHPKH